MIELDGVRLLTDPVLGGWVGPLRRQSPPPSAEVEQRIDAILISHLHRDHVDPRSLRRAGARAALIVPAGTRPFFASRGFEAMVELATGESWRVGPLTVTATPAAHEIGRRGIDAEPVGFLIEGSQRVYFAGDTDLHEGMAELGAGLDLALLPVWGWGPTLGPGHLDPERAAAAAALLAPRVAVPIHWGTFYPPGMARLRPRPLREPPWKFAASVRRLAREVRPDVVMPGSHLAFAPSR